MFKRSIENMRTYKSGFLILQLNTYNRPYHPLNEYQEAQIDGLSFINKEQYFFCNASICGFHDHQETPPP